MFLALLVAASAAATEKKVFVRCGERRHFSVPAGEGLRVTLGKCGDESGKIGSSQGWAALFRPAIRAGVSVGSEGIALAANAEIGVRLHESVELVGQANGSFGESRYTSTGFAGGAGVWLSNQVRLAGFVGGATTRTSSWNYVSAGPYAALQGDIAPSGRKTGGVNISLRVYGGPAWDDKDIQIGQWGVSLMVGWMAGR